MKRYLIIPAKKVLGGGAQPGIWKSTDERKMRGGNQARVDEGLITSEIKSEESFRRKQACMRGGQRNTKPRRVGNGVTSRVETRVRQRIVRGHSVDKINVKGNDNANEN